MKLSTFLVWSMVACIAAMAACFALPFLGLYWLPFSGEEAAGSAFIGFVCAVFMRVIQAAIDRGRAVRLLRYGHVVCPAALLGWILAIHIPALRESSNSLAVYVVCAALSAVGAWLTATAVILLIRVRRTWAKTIQAATVIVLLALALIGAYAVSRLAFYELAGDYRATSQFAELMARACSGLAILAGLGLLALLVQSSLLRAEGAAAIESERKWFNAICPRCGSRGRLRTEGDACASCGLGIKVSAA